MISPPSEELQLAMEHHQNGRWVEADAGYRRVLAARPGDAEALHYLGLLAHQFQREDVALDLMNRSLAVAPARADFHNNLGEVHRSTKQWDSAINCYRRAIELSPTYAMPLASLSDVLRELGRFDEASAAAREAVRISPDLPNGWLNLANALVALNQFEDAVEAYHRAIALAPADPLGYANLGIAHQRAGQRNEAMAAYQGALGRDGNHIPGLLGIAALLIDMNRPADSLIYFRRVIELDPHHAEAHAGLGVALLGLGEFQEGWSEYEWRWQTRAFPSPRHDLPQPYWNGESLAGRTILLYAEQGFGDTIFFARYIPLVAARGARVILLCQRELKSLLARMPGVNEVVIDGDPWPQSDFQLPLGSLPLRFRTNLASIPGGLKYLNEEPSRVARWREQLEQSAHPPRVGFIWAGAASNTNDRHRSTTLEEWSPLFTSKGLTLISLQKGADAKRLIPPPHLVLVGDELADFDDTAAVLVNLDLIITVDTAVAHLAGALGIPTWVLLSCPPDWRWLQERDDSPWYPSLRLFRRSGLQETGAVISRIAANLEEWVSAFQA